MGIPYIPAGTVEVWFVPTIANPAAPTAVALNAGTRLTSYVRGGITIDFASNPVPSGALDTRFEPTVAGTFGGGTNSLNGVLRKDAFGDDDAWTLLVRDLVGFLVVGDYGNTGAAETWAATDRVSVYPIEIFSRNRGDAARDQLHTFDVQFGITAVPSEDVAVV